MATNRILQVVGVALVIISLAVVAYVVQVGRVNTLSIHQPLTTTGTTPPSSNKTNQVPVSNNPRIHIVQILFGDGKEGWNARFFSPSRTIIHQGDLVQWINDDTVGILLLRYDLIQV